MNRIEQNISKFLANALRYFPFTDKKEKKSYNISLRSFERKDLYGQTKTIRKDKNGNKLKRAYCTLDHRHIITNGKERTYIDTNGNVVNSRSSLTEVDLEGNPIEKHPSMYKRFEKSTPSIEKFDTISIDEFLLLNFEDKIRLFCYRTRTKAYIEKGESIRRNVGYLREKDLPFNLNNTDYAYFLDEETPSVIYKAHRDSLPFSFDEEIKNLQIRKGESQGYKEKEGVKIVELGDRFELIHSLNYIWTKLNEKWKNENLLYWFRYAYYDTPTKKYGVLFPFKENEAKRIALFVGTPTEPIYNEKGGTTKEVDIEKMISEDEDEESIFEEANW